MRANELPRTDASAADHYDDRSFGWQKGRIGKVSGLASTDFEFADNGNSSRVSQEGRCCNRPDFERFIGSGDAAVDFGRGGVFLMSGEQNAEAEQTPHFLGAALYLMAGAVAQSVNHALAYGLPVLAFPCGPDRPCHYLEIDYVRQDHTGWLAEHRTNALIDSSLRHLQDFRRKEAILHYPQIGP